MLDLHGPNDQPTGDIIEILKFKSLASTNQQANDLLKNGQTPPFWVLADEQTAGRGRHGRQWQSANGNLYTTTGRHFSLEAGALSSLSLVTGVALYDAITNSATRPLNLTLKWPNDLLSGEAKLGGILIESQKSQQATGYDLAIGIGLNISAHPSLIERKTSSLSALGHNGTRDQIFNELTKSFDNWLNIWNKGEGLAAILDAWLKRAAPLNTAISVRLGDKRLEGRFAGLDKSGALLLKREDDSLKIITGGEVL